jgi:hopanoid-associated sugar epimerase
MRAFVTGGGGFIGGAVIRRLLAEGYDVRTLIRPGEATPLLEGLPVERVTGDLADLDALRRGVDGCDLVFHLAALYSFWGHPWEEFYRSNVEGTRNALQAAWDAGASRIVYTSSIATLGQPPADGSPADEETPSSLAGMLGHYKRSKYMAEQVAHDFARRGAPVVIVNPSMPVGVGDHTPTPSGRMIIDFLNGKMPAYVDTTLTVVDVDDVAAGHLLAAEKGRIGERYILGGEVLTLKQLLDLLADVSGLPPARWRIPHAAALAWAYVDVSLAAVDRRHVPVATPTSARLSYRREAYSSAKAVRELGFAQTPAREALRKAVDWYRANGYAPPAPGKHTSGAARTTSAPPSKEGTMKAVVFDYDLPRIVAAMAAGKVDPRAYLATIGPTQLKDVPEPKLIADDWTVVRTVLCGICGSDTKLVFIDAQMDNPLSGFVSFPFIPGHEAVGVVEKIGPAVKRVRPGDRVALNPWLSCAPRGIEPVCSACARGHYYLCEHFADGRLSPALHNGNCRDAGGAFAPLFPAHESQLFRIPDDVAFEQAVVADPFSVSMHAVLKAPPAAGAKALVYGCGTLGLLAIGFLRAAFPETDVVAVARYPFQQELAEAMGARWVLPSGSTADLVRNVAGITGERPIKPRYGPPWLHGGVDVIYDSVGSADTLAAGLRVARPLSRIVITGVSKPKRFEWTPQYFKEIELVGSNAFGVEELEGHRKHAFEIFFDLLSAGRLALPPVVTHRFALEEYREALLVAHQKGRNRTVKAVFAFPGSRTGCVNGHGLAPPCSAAPGDPAIRPSA